MNESEFCGVIRNSFPKDRIFKIPDPTGQFSMTIKRAFDGIGILEKEGKFYPLYWEAKYLNKASAFNFNRIEAHQDYFLRMYKKIENATSWVIVGINFGRADKRVFIFDWDENFGELYAKGFSLHKKMLQSLPYNKISKGKFDPANIIKFEDLRKLGWIKQEN